MEFDWKNAKGMTGCQTPVAAEHNHCRERGSLAHSVAETHVMWLRRNRIRGRSKEKDRRGLIRSIERVSESDSSTAVRSYPGLRAHLTESDVPHANVGRRVGPVPP